MKWIAIIILCLFGVQGFATDYYVKNGGDDDLAGTSDDLAWETIGKVNAVFLTTQFVAGDRIFFKRGSTFNDTTLRIARNGNSVNPITISAYGTGANPIFSGFQVITFTSAGSNRWTATIPKANVPNMVTWNNVVQKQGRYPNYGYIKITSAVGRTSVTATTLPATPDWDGAVLKLRPIHDAISNDTVLNHTGTTITYKAMSPYTPPVGAGFFIADHISTLDTAGEWYMNRSTRLMTFYALANPTNVKVAIRDTLIYVGAFDYITISNITFEGANVSAINFGSLTGGQNIGTTISNCKFYYSGRNAIYGTNNTGSSVTDCFFNYSLNNAVMLENEGGRSLRSTFLRDTIRNTAFVQGMTWNLNGNGISVYGDVSLIQYNRIDTVGHSGIAVYQDSIRILNNYVNYTNFITDDAGSINFFDLSFGAVTERGRIVADNIIRNGVGAPEGTANNEGGVHGVYLDDRTDFVEVLRNSISTMAYGGIYLHNTKNITIRDNIMYNAHLTQFIMVHDDHAVGDPIRNTIFTGNLLFTDDPTAEIYTAYTRDSAVDRMFSTVNNNRWARPRLITGAMVKTIRGYGISNSPKNDYTLATWKSAFAAAPGGAYDPATTEMGSNTNATMFVYNASNSASTQNFSGLSYVDAYGNIYNNSVTLAPWTAKVLIANGSVPPVNVFPTANAGADIVLTLPASGTSRTGTGNDPDGTIISYLWTQISGPNTATLTNANTATVTFSGLIEGIYQFQLEVRDNSNAPGTDVMRITVNPAVPNTPPTANAGADQSITLPTQSTSVTGSGTNGSGSSRTYLWTKVGGPATFNIVSPTSATTTINGLSTAGTYAFRLKVTNNLGDTAVDNMIIVVNPQNIAPTANAGADQSITLPTSSTTLVGSGTDPDGTIVAYLWTKESGPAGGTISASTSATTGITALQQGTYVYSLKVTDDDGRDATDLVQIVVNAANINPTANAGSDQVITLPTSTTTLTGSGTDPDGSIASYAWTKISGPSGGTITSPSSATTGITALQQGTYIFKLVVHDNQGLPGEDFVQVVVNAANIRPSANAGADQSITLPTSSTTLVGSGSDPDGSIVSYAWTKIGGPAGGNITSPSTATTGINSLQQGTYIFKLVVTDNQGLPGEDFVQIVVNAANIAPTAFAGSDQTITLPTNSTTLIGSGTDPDGSIASYLWTKISGPTGGTITAPNSSSTGITGLQQGTYVFKLEVRDNQNLPGEDFVQIFVSPQPLSPTANAGNDQTITLPTSTATLTGSGNDPDGTITGYLWTKLSGPTGGTITSSTSATTGVTALQAGAYVFQLRVTDNSGDTATDAMQITVNAANIPPTVNAGTNQTITLPTSSTTLVGSATDPDGTIASYLWTKISGPTGGAITSSTSSTTGITGLTQGVYVYRLRATDNSGDTASNAVQITVNAANVRPTVNAGANQTITLPTSTTTLVGSATDPDGTITAYLWTKISGPTGGAITSSTSATTGITGLTQGVYVFRLRATDNSGDTASNAVQVTVNAANVKPVVDAGANQTITLPTDFVTLSGTATDADGTIASVAWTKVSGPSGGAISSPSSLTTAITGLTSGVYIYQLTANDNSGDTTSDVVQVTVNAANVAPNAVAGSDQTIELPTTTAAVDGSGSTDPDGTIVSYEWTQISGPTTATLGTPNIAQTDISDMVQGDYIFSLKVVDNSGDSAVDAVQITVLPEPVIFPPVASAGADQVITLPLSFVNLSGSANPGTNAIASHTWTKFSGPAGESITDASAYNTTVTGLTEGTYLFQLTATDTEGIPGTDLVQIIVRPAVVLERKVLLGYKIN